MASEMDDDVEIKKLTISEKIYASISFLLTDIFVYSFIIPIIGTYLGGATAKLLSMPPRWELVLIVSFTFALLYGIFSVIKEVSYWMQLFAFDSFYKDLLRLRDVVNAIIIIVCLIGLASSIEAIIEIDKGMKTTHISEGIGYVSLKMLCDLLHINRAFLDNIGIKPSNGSSTKTSTDDVGENGKYENGAAYMLYCAMLSAGAAKAMYFSTLFTYLRAMEIFHSMNPKFDNEDDADNTNGASSPGFRYFMPPTGKQSRK